MLEVAALKILQNLYENLSCFCVIFNQIYFDFERSDLFNKNAKLSHDEIKKSFA